MKIYLLDFNINLTNAWNAKFKDFENVEVINDEFDHFVKSHKDLECIVSPGNSFGIMTGGYDGAITKYFGVMLMAVVQDYIKKHYDGCQPVSTAFIVKIPNTKMHLIHCPTMAIPSVIKDPTVVYDCTKAVLKVAKENKIKSIVLPAFGGLTGGLEPEDIASQMFKAINEMKKDA